MKTQTRSNNATTPRPFFGRLANETIPNLTGAGLGLAAVLTHDQKEVTMKTQLRIASLLALTALCLALAAIPASAQGIGLLYDNGPAASSQGNPARISDGLVVTDEVEFKDRGLTGFRHYVNSFTFVAWVETGDSVGCVNWSIDSQPFGPLRSASSTLKSHNYGGGTSCSPQDLSAVFLFQKESPPNSGIFWNIYDVTVSFSDVNLPPETLDNCPGPGCGLGPTTVYLTLWGQSQNNYRLYWHSDGATGALGNDGKGGGVSNIAYVCDTTKYPKTCNPGLPSLNVKPIQSESFDIIGYEQ